MIDRSQLPRPCLPRGEFRQSDLPRILPQYSGDLRAEGCAVGDDHRSVHMAFAIALTNVDQQMAFEAGKCDTLDAITQAWIAITPDDVDVLVEYSRSATSITLESE